MEVAAKFEYKTDQFVPFGLGKAAQSELYCVASRSKAYILELVYSHHCDERIFMEQSTLDDLSKFIPSHGVPKQAANIFNRATKQEQDRLLIDYHLMSEELKVSGERVAISHSRWSPLLPDLPGKHYLAYVTNFGGCEIRQKHTGKQLWCIKVHNIAKDWMINCQKNMKYAFNSFDTYEEAVYSIKINAIAWNNLVIGVNTVQFCFVTANGTIAFYDIGETLQMQFQKQINHKQINAIEWFTFDDKQNQRHSYVITCEMKGTVNLFRVQYDQNNGNLDDVIELAQLCTEADDVCVSGIQWEYFSQNNQLIVVTCKGMNVFVCLFSVDKQAIVSTFFHYIGHLAISGITKRSPLEYVVGTLSGHLEYLRIKLNSNMISIESEELKQPSGHSKYALYGLASSTNSAFLLGAYFAGRPYDHLALREPGHIAVCHQLGGLKSLDMLLNNSTYSLANMQDLAEAIRNVQLRNDKIFQHYLSTYPTEIAISDEYIYSLKVRSIVCSARSTFLRQKNRLAESGNLLGEYNILKKFIFAIQSYKILSQLKTNHKKLNQFQKLSAQRHRTSLQDFINLSIFDEYEAIKDEFRPMIEDLSTAMDKFNEKIVVERCPYCDTPIDPIKCICEQEHELPKCCISLTHIPMMGQYQCKHCQLFAFDDTQKLKQIMPSQNTNEPICPLCDLPMEQPHLTFNDYSD